MGTESLAELELMAMLAAIRFGPDAAYSVSVADDVRKRTGRPVALVRATTEAVHAMIGDLALGQDGVS